ncbi:FliG C-terminal domain-containing protein [Entomospira nematocerorum]|uniref:Flagellar motor switch protein FliG n=1 Tax=Entomospira nematocerorum TaxID=2719987 RepID=A0A968GCG1_9SPIO|nr:FliG C-terminal domain-containing protein [Entomospira nematocera]NIZ46883.1 hypothetical protein [Entomospira nematocera]WDI33318.1 FliG C-terminal domain-containing protein [Entomospira nematocera]
MNKNIVHDSHVSHKQEEISHIHRNSLQTTAHQVENNTVKSASEENVVDNTTTGKPVLHGSGVRRSAELLMMMGADAAKDALSHMTVDEIQQVMQEIELIRTERKSKSSQMNTEIMTGGINAAKGFLKTAFGENESERILRSAVPELSQKPFAFLEEIPEDHVLALLKEESIEILAIIIPRLKHSLAKRIVESVPPYEQADLVKRIVKVKRIDTQVIVQIERVLQERLKSIDAPLEEEELDGKETLVQILRHMPAHQERSLLENLAKDEPITAKTIEQELFTEEILFWLEAKELQQRLRTKHNDEIAFLIKGRSKELRALLLNALSKRRAEAVLQEETVMGLVSKREVDRVMREFLDEIREDEKSGKVVLMRPGELFL